VASERQYFDVVGGTEIHFHHIEEGSCVEISTHSLFKPVVGVEDQAEEVEIAL
jgi:hypothetical protein